MKQQAYIVLLFLLIILPHELQAGGDEKIISLKGKWYFSIGDDPAFSKPGTHDSNWDKIYVPSAWENQGYYGYDGYAWYRKWFYMSADKKGKELFVDLGNIDDVDEVYINGSVIGRTGSFPPDYKTAYDRYRRYTIPSAFVNYGGYNLIAVRVYDSELEGGILRGENIGIYSRGDRPMPDYDLSGYWKFATGDDPNCKKPDYDDRKWDDLVVPGFWENQGYANYDGFAWYRKKFTLPGYLADKNLVLEMGKIDDFDEVYVNGVLIGHTGKMPEYSQSGDLGDAYQVLRGYYIPKNLLRADKENTISVRVYDGFIDGGIYEGPIGLITQEKYIYFWKTRKNDNGFWEWFKNLGN